MSITPEARERLYEAKPFESMDNSEMVHYLLDVYEDQENTD